MAVMQTSVVDPHLRKLETCSPHKTAREPCRPCERIFISRVVDRQLNRYGRCVKDAGKRRSQLAIICEPIGQLAPQIARSSCDNNSQHSSLGAYFTPVLISLGYQGPFLGVRRCVPSCVISAWVISRSETFFALAMELSDVRRLMETVNKMSRCKIATTEC